MDIRQVGIYDDPAVDYSYEVVAINDYRDIGGPLQTLIRFPNNYGLSIIRGGIMAYATDTTYEVGIIEWTGDSWDFIKTIPDPTFGWQTVEDVNNLAREWSAK